MTISAALVTLKLYTSPDIHPKLSDGEMLAVLARYPLDDGSFDDDGVHRAIADCWDLKCNKATDHHDVSVNGRNFSAAQVKAHCEERARFYRRRLAVHVA